MAEYIYNLNLEKISKVANLVLTMTEGGAASKEQRNNINEKLKKVWPEAFEVGIKRDMKKKGKVIFTSREVKAFAHGLIELMQRQTTETRGRGGVESRPGTSGEDYKFCRECAEYMKIWNYVSDIIKPDEAPEFDGELDDAKPLVDDDKKAQAKPPRDKKK